jgi:hypothetical protein
MRALRSLVKKLAGVATLALLVSSGSLSQAAVVYSVEAPGVQSSQAGAVITETFNSLALGSHTLINSSIGTYTAASPGGMVVPPDQYGGSNQTQYLAIGAQSSPTTIVDLNFFGPQSYFGFYFPAMDRLNRLEVYDGASLVLTLGRAILTPDLTNVGGPFGNGHYGNPNTNQNTDEPYAYVNILGTFGSTFTRIRFLNLGTGTGFETDNHSILSTVPEPASVVSAGIGGLSLLGFGLRRRLTAKGRQA